jgi:hypothetical protein
MRWPPDRSPTNARKLRGWTREETKRVVAYKAEAGAEVPETAPDPSTGSGATMGC